MDSNVLFPINVEMHGVDTKLTVVEFEQTVKQMTFFEKYMAWWNPLDEYQRAAIKYGVINDYRS